MRLLRLVAGLTLAAGSAQAQLAVTPADQRLLVLPLGVSTPADSVTSIQLTDAIRDKLIALARYKAIIITKAKYCEALTASGFSCDGLLDEQQGPQLARFLQVHAYTAGQLAKSGTAWTVRMRVVDIASSGFAASFTTRVDPGTIPTVADSVAQRLFLVIRAGEYVRQCNKDRAASAFPRAIQSAGRAFALDPNTTGAHLCVLNVYEAQRLPPDSLIAAARRALKGDSLNTTAWDRLASAYQQKGDTAHAIEAYIGRLNGDRRNTRVRLGLSQLLFQQKRYQEAADILGEGLAMNAGDQAMLELRRRVCIEGSLWKCAVESLTLQAAQDTMVLRDSTWLRTVLGAAQQAPDTAALLHFTKVATDQFARSASFWKARGSAYETAGKADSAIWAYRKALDIDPTDVATSLLVGKAMVDGAVWDTAAARQLASDTARLTLMRQAFASRLDTAKVFITRGLTAPDSALRLNATVIMLTAGSKLAQAQAYVHAYPWLDQTLREVAPRTPADTIGPRLLVRTQASFWYGVASSMSLGVPYGEMVRIGNDKNTPQAQKCDAAKAINDRIQYTREALIRGGRVAPSFAQQMLNLLGRYEDQMPNVRRAFKCRNF